MGDSVIQAVVGKLVENLADALKNQVRYLCCYSCNVQALVDEVGELNIRHQSVQQDVNIAKANYGVIRPEVEAWLRKVEDLQSRSDKIRGHAEEIQRSNLCKLLPMLHYSLSRKALKTAKDSVELRNTKFDKIFNPIIPSDIPPIPTTSNVRFESRDSIENKIVDALKDPSVHSIGIWGIGGVGKTVMAKKIEKRVLDEKLFERVVMVVVSQQPNLPKIQSQIAEGLGLPLSEESLVFRQRKLHQRLMAEKGILIILDDLWEGLDLEEFGIPSQSTLIGCKLILTSRNKDALTSTGVPIQNIFPLEILTEEESWRFFKDNAGINVDDNSHDELVQIAKKVERECMRLPLALKIVACALKDKGISFWNNAARELEKHAPNNIPGVMKGVYGSLLFSINALEGKEQKDLFLLCCLFPEDYFISIEELLRCVMGLGIFKEIENLTEAGDKVETMLNILLSRSLLLEGDEEMYSFNVRMHDVIRDVGIWIATEEGIVMSNKKKYRLIISHGVNEWPLTMEEDSNDNNYYYTCISLIFSHHHISFPKLIVCPKLEFLRLDFFREYFQDYYMQLPENFFSGMGGLRVLDAFSIGLLPPSMGQLNNLRTLSLLRCKIFERISVLAKLTNLEMLSLINCEFEVLPTEIGDLIKLKQMEISDCRSLKRIAFGVVSRLAKLEELVIWDSFGDWEAEGRAKEDIACLFELNGLKYLTTLKIEIRNPSVVPRQKPLWIKKLKKYGIIVSKCDFDFEKERFQKAILLGEVVNPLGDWIYDMASDVECVNLEGSNCRKFLKGLSKQSGNLSCLKHLRVSHFTDIQYLAEGLQNSIIFSMLKFLRIEKSNSLVQIAEVSPLTGSFVALESIELSELSRFMCLWKFSIKEQLYLRNLQKVEIENCDNLSYLFSLSVAQSLLQLTDLSVRCCQTIKEIFKKEDGESVEINKIKLLPKLRKIEFFELDSFYCFCNEMDRIELPELYQLWLCDLPRLKMTRGDNNEVHQKHLISEAVGISFNFCGLYYLNVAHIGNFKCMFPLSDIISGLPSLCWLRVMHCSMLEHIVEKDKEENIGGAIIFPNLNYLNLSNLSNIRTFCYNAIQFPSLEELSISNCPLMQKFVEELTDDISNSRPFLNKQVQCPKLKKLTLGSLNISGVFSPLFFKSLTVLEELDLSGCEELEHMITKKEGQTATNTEEGFIQKVPLKRFSLIKLPKLYGSIFQIKNNLEFPLLEEIKIEDCPMLEYFSLGYLHLPKLEIISGLLNIEVAAKFFSNKEMFSREIHSENNCFIISHKDISFNSNTTRHFLRSNSSESFVDAITIFLNYMRNETVGKFGIEKIRIGIKYEIMMMIILLNEAWLKDPVEIELKLSNGNKLQCTRIEENHPRGTWTEISIGKFVRESEEDKQLEFSMHSKAFHLEWGRRLSIKGVRIVEV